MASIEGLIEAAEASGNPHTLAFALHAFSLAFHDIDPACALDALRRRLKIAEDSGNRYDATNLATMLCRIEAVHGDPLAAFDYFTLAIGRYLDSCNNHDDADPIGRSR